MYQRYLNGDSSIDTLGERDKFHFMVSYGPTPPPEFTASPSVSLDLPPSPPLSPPKKKLTLSPFYKPIVKWAKRHSYSLEAPTETPLSSSIAMFHEIDFPLLV